MTKEEEIKIDIRNQLLELTDNLATIILIESKIADFGLANFERGFKEASDIAFDVVKG